MLNLDGKEGENSKIIMMAVPALYSCSMELLELEFKSGRPPLLSRSRNKISYFVSLLFFLHTYFTSSLSYLSWLEWYTDCVIDINVMWRWNQEEKKKEQKDSFQIWSPLYFVSHEHEHWMEEKIVEIYMDTPRKPDK